MAITIYDEGERKVDIVSIAMWATLLLVVGISVYFIFFKQPGLVEVVSPANYKNIDPLANVTLNPEEVVNGKDFQSLKQYVPLPPPAEVGRVNPFLRP